MKKLILIFVFLAVSLPPHAESQKEMLAERKEIEKCAKTLKKSGKAPKKCGETMKEIIDDLPKALAGMFLDVDKIIQSLCKQAYPIIEHEKENCILAHQYKLDQAWSWLDKK